MAITSNANLTIERPSSDSFLLRLSGNCREQKQAPRIEDVRKALEEASEVRSLSFHTAALTGWDSRFIAFVRNCAELCRTRNVELQDDGLPEGVRRLLRLAQAVPEKTDARHTAARALFLQALGERALALRAGTEEILSFFGENMIALGKLLRGRAQFRWSDAFLVMEECGPQGLGIVAMINFLVGLILAFVGG